MDADYDERRIGSSRCTSRVRPSRRQTRSAMSPVRTSWLPRSQKGWKGSSPNGEPRRTDRGDAALIGRRSSPFGPKRWSWAPGRMAKVSVRRASAPSSSGSPTPVGCATSAKSAPDSAQMHAERSARSQGSRHARKPVHLRAPVRRCSQGPLRASGARGRGRIRRMDHGRPAAPPHLAGSAPRQVTARGRGGMTGIGL